MIRNVAIKQKLPSGRLSVSPAVGRVWQGVRDGLISGLASPSSGSEEEDVLGLSHLQTPTRAPPQASISGEAVDHVEKNVRTQS